MWRWLYIQPHLYLSLINMGKMNIVLSDELEDRFRRGVYERKGYKKGNISEALEEALELWLTECDKKADEKK